ncbi:acyl-CoA carboxylase subunit epsilon [Arthrobacter cryoconiti]|uniref:Acyl-CoA carboxylase subunit epsilon n=1 Tax=Arthrobacter cryoconiti TaxID=748907 RepID=A0ABV8R3X2_9MICC|nr:acyl-CoA carboxylase subunit epsilon [Arthrobacter cryoconiti]MCC9067068.1 acyl-CoA carboxylase subunit epsilon [Arthrobacter cryoconiti]
MSDHPTKEPLLKVTHGNPTAEELAAVTAVVLALQSGADGESVKAPSRSWARRAQLNLPPKPGAGSWRRSRH